MNGSIYVCLRTRPELGNSVKHDSSDIRLLYSLNYLNTTFPLTGIAITDELFLKCSSTVLPCFCNFLLIALIFTGFVSTTFLWAVAFKALAFIFFDTNLFNDHLSHHATQFKPFCDLADDVFSHFQYAEHIFDTASLETTRLLTEVGNLLEGV